MNQLAEKITLVRKQRGLSQEEFANRLGVSRQTVSQWELGEVIPKTSRLVKICKEFNINPGDLINTSSQNPDDKEIAVDEEYIREQLKVIKNENQPKNKMNSSTMAGVEHISKAKKIRKVFLMIFLILLAVYIAYSIYKLAVILYVTARVQKYKNPDNYYCKIIDYGANDMNEKVNIWYKDGMYKIITEYKEDGKTIENYRWIDLNINKRYEYNSDEGELKEYDITEDSTYTKKDYQKGEYMYNYFPDDIRNEKINYFLFSIKPKTIQFYSKGETYFLNINGYKFQFDKTDFELKSVSKPTENVESSQQGMRYYNIKLGITTDKDLDINVKNLN